MVRSFITPQKILLAGLVMLTAVFACARSVTIGSDLFAGSSEKISLPAMIDNNQPLPEQTGTVESNAPAGPVLSPTPDPPHELPEMRQESEEYVVKAADSLNQLAQEYGVSVDQIVKANDLPDPDYLEVGQVLVIPPPTPAPPGPSFKIIPDSELVYGPASADFNISEFIQSQDGYLASYSEEVDGRQMSGARIVERVAQEYSVNPRLLLAVLEYQSGWVTRASPDESSLEFPIGVRDSTWRKGLYFQLAWAANSLNRGFYLWRVNGLAGWALPDGSSIPVSPLINAGTAGVQHFFSQLYGQESWKVAVSEGGLFAVYKSMFGSPFSRSVEPLLPPGLSQPDMQLPFEAGQDWSFTGGPHGGWGSGSAWAAIDFAPPGEALGCVESDAWVVAVADGPIVRAGNGAVIQDLDTPDSPADGKEQTGWTVLYMHIETRERVKPGTYLHAGERVGHPSCEGGVSTGTHVHLARRYNGEWIPADQNLPFVLDGWVSKGLGAEYDGVLKKAGKMIEALEGRFPENSISR